MQLLPLGLHDTIIPAVVVAVTLCLCVYLEILSLKTQTHLRQITSYHSLCLPSVG